MSHLSSYDLTAAQMARPPEREREIDEMNVGHFLPFSGSVLKQSNLSVRVCSFCNGPQCLTPSHHKWLCNTAPIAWAFERWGGEAKGMTQVLAQNMHRTRVTGLRYLLMVGVLNKEQHDLRVSGRRSLTKKCSHQRISLITGGSEFPAGRRKTLETFSIPTGRWSWRRAVRENT